MALAERTGGIVDHALSEAQYRNFKILQTSGWVMSTLTETRNRADLFIIAGSDIHKLHPRFFETVVVAAGLDVRGRRAEAHGRLHRQGARPLRRQRLAHRRGGDDQLR